MPVVFIFNDIASGTVLEAAAPAAAATSSASRAVGADWEAVSLAPFPLHAAKASASVTFATLAAKRPIDILDRIESARITAC